MIMNSQPTSDHPKGIPPEDAKKSTEKKEGGGGAGDGGAPAGNAAGPASGGAEGDGPVATLLLGLGRPGGAQEPSEPTGDDLTGQGADEGALISERELAEQLGVLRTSLKKIRGGFQEGFDWTRCDETRAVVYTEAGVKKVREALQLPEPPADAVQMPALPTRQRHHVLTVVRPTRFARIVECVDADGKPCRLRVKDNSNFTGGMKVATCVHEQADLYCFEGRLPRRRGKW
jgi:hypothetical protein